VKYKLLQPVDARRELQRVSDMLAEPTFDQLELTQLNAVPARPQDGQLVYADGTNWNPGSGAGLYAYWGGAWRYLGPYTPPAYPTLTSVSSVLGADVAIAIANTWYTGASVALTAGTWLLTGHITINRTTTTAWTASARLRDNAGGGVNYASAGSYRASVANNIHTLPLTAVVVAAGAVTIDMQATANQTGVIKAALVTNAAGNTATQLHAVRIA
jgi:hypothetical protein